MKEIMIGDIDARLMKLLDCTEQPRLREAMRYSVLGGGKRLRPRFLLAAHEAAAGACAAEDISDALDFACALELIHAYSLVHDDLPAMDDDDLRRGRATTHIQYDEATAILVGDALLNRAYEVMAQTCAQKPNLPRLPAAMAIIAAAAGANGMIGGQMDDLLSEGKKIDLNTLWHLHRRKTGALFSAALEAGAVLGGGSQEFAEGMKNLGALVGISFQMRDDILDVTSTTQALGKPVGSDTKNQKVTFVSLQGLENACNEYEAICAETLDKVKGLPCKTTALHDLISQIISREK